MNHRCAHCGTLLWRPREEDNKTPHTVERCRDRLVERLKSSKSRRPMQPVVMLGEMDGGGNAPVYGFRFKENAIIEWLYEQKRFNLNELTGRDFSQADQEQFAQLIGYSVAGYHELSYVSDESAWAATEAVRKLLPSFHACRDRGCEIHCGVERKP